MRKFVPAVLVAGLAVFAFAQDALAGSITEASGPIKVNGKPATVPVTLKKGDTVDTGSSTATFKSDAGDTVAIERNTSAKSEGVESGVEYFFIVSGGATGNLSPKTTLGVSVSWATAPEGQRTEVRVEAPADKPGIEGRFRTIKGGTWLRNDTYSTWLPADHSVTLWRDRTKKGALCFRTSQQNEGKVEINKMVSGGNIRIFVPRATSGCVEDWIGNKTKISNEITSNKQDKIHIETEFGSKSAADVGPGTFALIDNQTGGIEVLEEVVDDSIGEELPAFDQTSDSGDPSATHRTTR